MKEFIKKIPITMTGLMLGLSALGNLLMSVSPILHNICGGIAVIILFALIAKLCFYPEQMKTDLSCPIAASVFGALAPSVMILSTYLIPYSEIAAFIVWIGGIIWSLCWMIRFTYKVIGKVKIEQVHASYFIPYIAIAVAAVTQTGFRSAKISEIAVISHLLGHITFAMGALLVIPIAIVIIYRYVHYRDINSMHQYLVCIIAAPVGVLMMAYIQTSDSYNIRVLSIGLMIELALFAICFVYALTRSKKQFYFSVAALSFPFVISTMAMKQTYMCIGKMMGVSLPNSQSVIVVTTLIATVFTIYACIRYAIYLMKNAENN